MNSRLFVAAVCGLSLTPLADAQTLIQAFPPTSPSHRDLGAAAYDGNTRQVMIFGDGQNPITGSDQTWLFDGQVWNLAAPASKPAVRYYNRMVFDSARQRVVMFGGAINGLPSVATDETWEWDGATWTRVVTGSSPPAGRVGALAFDSWRGRTVLFNDLAETWEYDGASWSRVTTATTPPATAPNPVVGSAAFDRVRGVIVMVAGSPFSPETWEYDGVNWTLRPTATALGWNLHRSTSVYDDRTGRIVYLDSTGQIWEYDGADWSRTLSVSTAAVEPFCAFDRRRGVTVITSGDATYDYRGRVIGTVSVSEPGCGGSRAPSIAPQAAPRVGQPYVIDVQAPFATSASMILAFQELGSPLDLSVLGMNGCTLYTGMTVVIPVALTAPGGTGSWQVSVPNNPWWGGNLLFNQLITIDPGAPSNALGVTLSALAEARIGH